MSTDQFSPRPGGTRSRPRWLVPVLILAVAAALIGGILAVRQVQGGPEDGADPAGSASPAAEEITPTTVAAPDLSGEASRDEGDLLAEGPVDAPVVLVVFTDYQCSFCAAWHTETLPELRGYVDRGELRIEYRDVNVYGEDSTRAARASLAAAMQGQHREYQEALFEGGTVSSASELSEESLVELAGELGMDRDQFRADMTSEGVAATIEANAQQGLELGATSTPAFILDGEPIAGAQPTAVFTEKIDAALAENGG